MAGLHFKNGSNGVDHRQTLYFSGLQISSNDGFVEGLSLGGLHGAAVNFLVEQRIVTNFAISAKTVPTLVGRLLVLGVDCLALWTLPRPRKIRIP